MKFFIVFALCVAAASAFVLPPIIAAADNTDIQQIIDAINHPSTDPATAAALEDMLLEILGSDKPQPVPLPEIIDESIYVEPANYPKPPPLVQVIINVNANAAGNPVAVEEPSPAIIPEDLVVVEQPIVPEPVIIAPIVPSPAITLPDTLN